MSDIANLMNLAEEVLNAGQYDRMRIMEEV